MKSRLLVVLAIFALVLALAPAAPVLAGPKYYGTGIHLWVLHCPNYGKIVSGYPCPNNPPAGCTCTRTWYDFPYDHPYGIARVNVGGEDGEGSNPGNVHVIVDFEEAIQCGVSVEPSPVAGSCGADFGVEAVDEWDVDPEIREQVEIRVREVEEATEQPVETIRYTFAHPQDGG